jgi:translation initiation factor 1
MQPTLSGGSVIVRHERKGHGGKTVTVADLSRVESGRNHDLDQVAKSLRKALGAGARAQDQCITVQGDQVERVAAFFKENFGAKVVLGTRK